MFFCVFETVIFSFCNIFGWLSNSNIPFASGNTLLRFSENQTFFLVMACSLLHYLYLMQLQFFEVNWEEIFVLASNFYCHHHHRFYHRHHQEVMVVGLAVEAEEAKKKESYYCHYCYYYCYYYHHYYYYCFFFTS